MDFTLGNTGPEDNTEGISSEINNAIINSIQAQLDAIQESLQNLVADYEGFKNRTTQSQSSTSRALSEIRASTIALSNDIDNLDIRVTTRKLNANNASISDATIQRLKVNSLVDLPEIEPESIKTPTGEIDSIKADTIESDNATFQNETVNTLKVLGALTVPEFTATQLTSTDLDTESADIEEARISKLSVDGVPVECEDVSFSGWTNGHLHKLDVKANGVLVFKFNGASIVLTPGNVSSNYDKLYAAYMTEDGYWHLYFDTDLEGQLLVIGTSDFAITDSLVLKTSVRRNADSNGQPNSGESVKVVVSTELPRVGQRNVIYVVLGDCAYYCDGQYFYEMASKKRG